MNVLLFFSLENIAEKVLQFFNTILGLLEPFIYWGSKYCLAVCIMIYCVSKDQKAVYNGIKIFMLYFTFCVIRSVMP